MNVKILAAAIATLTLTAQAEKYDYEVEYVKSTRGSVVKTDLVPSNDLTFRLDVKFDGEYNHVFTPGFNGRTCEFFGQENGDREPEVSDVYMLGFGMYPAHTNLVRAFLGKFDHKAWVHLAQQVIENTTGSRIDIVYDGGSVNWAGHAIRLSGPFEPPPAKAPIALFGKAEPDGKAYPYGCYEMTFYGASFYRDHKPVADFIPVVKGGVAGIYDKVGKKFYSSVAEPLTAGPKGSSKKAPLVAKRKSNDFSVPVFEEDFSSDKVFAERWDFFGHSQDTISVKDGAVRIATSASWNGIDWRGEPPDEYAVEADLVCYPEWCGQKDAGDGDYRWAHLSVDGRTFGIRSDGFGVVLITEDAWGGVTGGAYPWIPDFKPQAPVRVRVERRRLGEHVMSYSYYVNGARYFSCTQQAPKKEVGFDGVARWPKIGISHFNCPIECRRFAVYELKTDGSPNLISNSGFEYDTDGVPMHYCNRGSFNYGASTVADYRDKYLRSFAVDRNEKHSGKQSLRLGLGPYQNNVQFFPWATPTQQGRAGVFSFWAKASDTNQTLEAKLDNARYPVKLTTDWRRYEFTTTNMPAQGLFSPVWFRVPDADKYTTEAAIWLDDLQLEFAEAPAGGFDPKKRYATEYRPRSGDDVRFAPGKPGPHPKPDRVTPLTAAENALCGYALPTNGLVLSRYDFYMNEPTADFRVWDGQGGFAEASVDIAKLPAGTHEVTVKALGRDWTASVVKRAYKKGATQINQWSRSLVHDGKPLFFCAPCLIGRENGPRKDGTSLQIDVLADAGFRNLILMNNTCTSDIEMNQVALKHAEKHGFKSVIWTGEGNLNEVGDIVTWHREPTDWSRRKMYDMLDSDDIVGVIAMDEPEHRDPNKSREYMKVQKSYFPYKPVLINCSWLGIAGRFAGLPTDVLMIDFYLTNDGTTLELVVSKVDVLRSIAPGKPCWYWMESENSLHQRIPSYKEQIAQCWGAVAAGANGISWFVNMPTSRGCYESIAAFNREVKDNESFLCSDELCGGAVASETSNYIRCLTRKVGDEWRIYTVNVNPHPNAKVAFRLPPEIPQDAKLEVMYENRTVQAKGGLFGDAFDGFARHVYRVKK